MARRLGILLLAGLAACSSKGRPTGAGEAPSRPAAYSGPIQDFASVEKHNGQRVTLTGVFDHVRGQHGLLTLDGGLVVTLPHFDQHRRGDDWFRYLGKRCTATGILHTTTRDIEGYGGPSLEVESFRGPSE